MFYKSASTDVREPEHQSRVYNISDKHIYLLLHRLSFSIKPQVILLWNRIHVLAKSYR